MQWQDFKKTFTEKQEEAIWQYFLDHSRIQPNGFWGIMFYIRDIDDFWQRVYSRYSGNFQRYDKLNKEHTQQLQACFVAYGLHNKKDRLIKQINESGSVWQRTLLYVNKKTNKALFGHLRRP